MFAKIAYYMIFGLPLFAWFGGLALLVLMVVAAAPVWNKMSKRTIPFSWHPKMAAVGLVLVFIHALLYMLARWR